MTDLSQTIAPKSDQLNADDLIGGPRTIKITRVSAAPDTPDQPVGIYFEGDNGKPYKPCKSMRRIMVAIWGADGAQYVGRAMTLYRDPKVAFGGMQVGGIRISHMSHMDSDTTMALTVTKAKRAPYTVKRLVLTDAAKTSTPPDMPPLTVADATTLARAAAGRGTDHFREWFNSSEGKECRATGALTPEVMLTMKQTATEADAAAEQDPFGLPPIRPTTATDPEIEAQILAELAARDAALTQAAE